MRLSAQGKTYKSLNRLFGKALHDYAMIRDCDRIAVCLSGGKDSWAMLFFLLEYQKKAPVRFSIKAIHIDLGFASDVARVIQSQTRQMGVAAHVAYTDFGVVAHSSANRENPCFLCAKLRRRRLFDLAEELGCNKLAFGHNRDDLIETLFLNMFYAGEMSSMMPLQPFFGGKLTLIRPMAYVDEETIRQFAEQMQWPIVDNPCPSADRSRRAQVKSLLGRLYESNPNIRGNIFRAMRHVKPEYLLKP